MANHKSENKVNNRVFIAARFLAEVSNRLANLIAFPLLAHALGAEGYGVNAQISVINGVLIPIAALGLGFSVVRTISGHRDPVRAGQTFFSTIFLVMATACGLAGMIAFLAPALNNLFFKVTWATPVIRWGSLLIIATALESILNDYFRARLRILFYSLLQSAQSAVYILGLFLILKSGGSLLNVIWLAVGVKFLIVIILFFYYTQAEKASLRGGLLPRQEFAKMLRFSLPIVVMGISLWLVSLGDRVVIGYFLTSRDVAIYSAAYALAGILGGLAAPFWGPLYPLMAQNKNEGDRGGIAAVCRKYTSAYFLVGFPALVGLTLIAPRLVRLLGTNEFTINPLVFGLIALGLFLDQFTAIAHYLIYLHDEPIFLRNVMVASGMFNLAMNVATVPRFGIAGAAATTLLTYGLISGLLFQRLKRYGFTLREIYDLTLARKFLLSSLGMGGIILLGGSACGTWPSMGRLVLMGAGSYAILIWTSSGFRLPRI